MLTLHKMYTYLDKLICLCFYKYKKKNWNFLEQSMSNYVLYLDQFKIGNMWIILNIKKKKMSIFIIIWININLAIFYPLTSYGNPVYPRVLQEQEPSFSQSTKIISICRYFQGFHCFSFILFPLIGCSYFDRSYHSVSKLLLIHSVHYRVLFLTHYLHFVFLWPW